MTYEEYSKYDRIKICIDIEKINKLIWQYDKFAILNRDEAINMLNTRRQLDQWVTLAAEFFYPQFCTMQFEYQSDWEIIRNLQWLRRTLQAEWISKEIVNS